MELPPNSTDPSLKQYLIRVFDFIEKKIAAKDVLPATTALPEKPIVGKLYYFPNTISGTITTAGVWVYKSTGWSLLG